MSGKALAALVAAIIIVPALLAAVLMNTIKQPKTTPVAPLADIKTAAPAVQNTTDLTKIEQDLSQTDVDQMDAELAQLDSDSKDLEN